MVISKVLVKKIACNDSLKIPYYSTIVVSPPTLHKSIDIYYFIYLFCFSSQVGQPDRGVALTTQGLAVWVFTVL